MDPNTDEYDSDATWYTDTEETDSDDDDDADMHPGVWDVPIDALPEITEAEMEDCHQKTKVAGNITWRPNLKITNISQLEPDCGFEEAGPQNFQGTIIPGPGTWECWYEHNWMRHVNMNEMLYKRLHKWDKVTYLYNDGIERFHVVSKKTGRIIVVAAP